MIRKLFGKRSYDKLMGKIKKDPNRFRYARTNKKIRPGQVKRVVPTPKLLAYKKALEKSIMQKKNIVKVNPFEIAQNPITIREKLD